MSIITRLIGPEPVFHFQEDSSPRRIPELDGLRGIAILLVVVFHYTISTARGPHHTILTKLVRGFGFGWSGVDLFFVLSGFLIGGILLDARNSEHYFKTFYVRRIFRIFPLYYLWLLIYLVVLAGGVLLRTSPDLFAVADLAGVFRYLIFIQNFFYQKSHLEFVWLAATWSLAVEEQYYLVAPLLIRSLTVQRVTQVLVATIFFAPFLRLIVDGLMFQGHLFASVVMPCRADNLAMGMLGAVAVRSNSFRRFIVAHPHFLFRGFLVSGVALLFVMPWFFRPENRISLSAGLSILAIFWLSLLLLLYFYPSGLIGRFARWEFLQRAGALSYCIYLIHSVVAVVVHGFLRHDLPRMDDWKGIGTSIIAALVTWGIASLSWQFFERPLLRRGHSYSY